MGKYMKKSKKTGEVALMEEASHAQSSFGIRTRAKTLALQRLQTPSTAAASASSSAETNSAGMYLELRSRRLVKPPCLLPHSYSRRQKHQPAKENLLPKPNPSRGKEKGGLNSRSGGLLKVDCLNKEKGCLDGGEKTVGEKGEIGDKENSGDAGIEASFGENMPEFEGRERSIRETTPCSLIRDPEITKTPGSSTRRKSSSIESNGRVGNSVGREVPRAHEMDEFFSGAEKKQQKEFIEKYNYDPVKDEPLPGRYEWSKIDP